MSILSERVSHNVNSHNVQVSLSAETEKFVIRFPKGMKTKIQNVSNQSRRSMNKEIVARLEHSLLSIVTVPALPERTLANKATTSHASGRVPIGAECNLQQKQAQIEAEKELVNTIEKRLKRLSFEKKKALLLLME